MLSPSQTPDIHETLHTALMTIPLYRSLFADELNRKLEKGEVQSENISASDSDIVSTFGSSGVLSLLPQSLNLNMCRTRMKTMCWKSRCRKPENSSELFLLSFSSSPLS